MYSPKHDYAFRRAKKAMYRMMSLRAGPERSRAAAWAIRWLQLAKRNRTVYH